VESVDLNQSGAPVPGLQTESGKFSVDRISRKPIPPTSTDEIQSDPRNNTVSVEPIPPAPTLNTRYVDHSKDEVEFKLKRSLAGAESLLEDTRDPQQATLLRRQIAELKAELKVPSSLDGARSSPRNNTTSIQSPTPAELGDTRYVDHSKDEIEFKLKRSLAGAESLLEDTRDPQQAMLIRQQITELKAKLKAL
jgi:hypothetical protein